ncbi:MAG: hypothetical protein LBC80_03900 [Treponema sp.]|jgi:hypothetical protein|nr:hypothetical protein [Treponema sp.]
MKKTFDVIVTVTIMLVITFSVVGCKREVIEDPITLAQQATELTIEAMRSKTDTSRVVDIDRKLGLLERKIDKLSEPDQMIFMSEFLRLTGEVMKVLFQSIGSMFEMLAFLGNNYNFSLFDLLLDPLTLMDMDFGGFFDGLSGTINDSLNILESDITGQINNFADSINDALDSILRFRF